MSTSVFVDLEISTQADGAQSSRVPVPIPKDPYEAIRSSYESSPSSSPLDLPTRKRYRGTFELVEDDEDMEESSDSDSVSEDAEDEGPTIEDEDLTARDVGLAARDEGPGMGVKSLGLGGDEDTLPSPEWSSGSLPISPTPSIVPSPISSPMIPLTISSPIASPATAETEGFLTELGAQVQMQGGLIRDHTRYRLSSLEHEQERVAVTFGAIWRPVLALESWAGQTDAQRATLWHAISDTCNTP
ncbi:hypothetical protein Tco_1358050, partial [Tanacetum coccineum]